MDHQKYSVHIQCQPARVKIIQTGEKVNNRRQSKDYCNIDTLLQQNDRILQWNDRIWQKKQQNTATKQYSPAIKWQSRKKRGRKLDDCSPVRWFSESSVVENGAEASRRWSILQLTCVRGCVCLCGCRQRDRQVLFYNGNVNRLFLEVNVSNTPSPGRPAEDAHGSMLNISIPQLLIYSGVRTKVVKVNNSAECCLRRRGCFRCA